VPGSASSSPLIAPLLVRQILCGFPPYTPGPEDVLLVAVLAIAVASALIAIGYTIYVAIMIYLDRY
jgi:hypothetical protein